LYASLVTWGTSAADGRSRPGGRDVGGELVEFPVGGERLADPLDELVLAQPALGERGLERLDHLLAVGARVGTAGLVHLIAGPGRHRYLLASTMV